MMHRHENVDFSQDVFWLECLQPDITLINDLTRPSLASLLVNHEPNRGERACTKCLSEYKVIIRQLFIFHLILGGGGG